MCDLKNGYKTLWPCIVKCGAFFSFIQNDTYMSFFDGFCGEEEYDIFKRAGRRFEIKHILDELH